MRVLSLVIKHSIVWDRSTNSLNAARPAGRPRAAVVSYGGTHNHRPNACDKHPMTYRPVRPTRKSGLGVLAAVLLCSLFVRFSADANGSELRNTPIVKAIQRAQGAVVNIRGEKTLVSTVSKNSTTESARRVNGMGTGVVIDPRGYVVTNFHVVDGVREIIVTTADGRRCTADLVARDMETDLAIIKVDLPEPLPVAPMGTSSDLLPGETVIAVGNAYGYEHTVTRGIVSALHRSVQVNDAQYYKDLIQTDASINPGNSGGPLLNIDGEMIGINVAVRAGAQGIGFAIPIDKVTDVAVKLLATYNSQNVWVGIESSSDAPATEKGMLIGDVTPKSPAADAGLEAGDVILAIDDAELRHSLDFQRTMLDRKAGDQLRLKVNRSGNPVELCLTVGDLAARAVPAEQPAWELLGVELQPIPADEFRKNYQTRYRGGLLVTAVRPHSPAAEQGIVPGDALVGMHIWETATLDNVAYILKRPDLVTLSPVKFFIIRGDETLYGFLPVLPTQTAQR